MGLTRTQRAADALLRRSTGTGLRDYLLDRDRRGVPATITARELAKDTDGVIDVTDQAIRDWVRQLRGEAPAVTQ